MRYLITVLFALCGAAILAACSKGPDRPVVMMETIAGNIEIEVYTDKAPVSAADFLLYVDKKYYNGEGFYRVVRADNDPRDMGMSLIQGGRLDSEPLTDPIAHELTKDTGLSNTEGVVSIARLEPGTGSAAYFFINIGDNSFLDFGGERESGDNVTTGQILTQPVKIVKAYRK